MKESSIWSKNKKKYKSIPKPEDDDSFAEIIDPIERIAEGFVMKKLRQYFGVRAIRAYFTMIFFGYMLDQANINVLERKINFIIKNQQEFTLYTIVYISTITILSFLDFRESKFFAELELNENMWNNFVQNIQPNIDDPDKKLLAMYSFKMEKTKKDLRDYFIKVVDEYIKELLEQVSALDFTVIELQQRLKELEPLQNLAEQIRKKRE